MPGIGPKTVERLRGMGIDTLGKLAAAPSAELTARFGPRYGLELQRRARFEDDSPVTQQRKVVSESRETTFDYDISDPARLEEILRGLVEQLCRALASQQRCGRTIGIKVRLERLLDAHPGAHVQRADRDGGPGRTRRTRSAAAFRRAASGAAARGARRRPGTQSPARRGSADARRLRAVRPEGPQYSALARRRRASRASGFSTPSSSRMPTTT